MIRPSILAIGLVLTACGPAPVSYDIPAYTPPTYHDLPEGSAEADVGKPYTGPTGTTTYVQGAQEGQASSPGASGYSYGTDPGPAVVYVYGPRYVYTPRVFGPYHYGGRFFGIGGGHRHHHRHHRH